MTNPNSGADSSEKLQNWAEELQQRAQRYDQLQEQLNSTSASERSSGGEVSVTVDANGVLTDLRLSDRIQGMAPASISALVMGCSRRAQAKLRDQVTELVHDSVGDDAPGNNIIEQYRQRFPDPPEDEPSGHNADSGERGIGALGEPDNERREPRRGPRRPSDDDPDDDGLGGSILR